jgi:hypothetical protein
MDVLIGILKLQTFGSDLKTPLPRFWVIDGQFIGNLDMALK